MALEEVCWWGTGKRGIIVYVCDPSFIPIPLPRPSFINFMLMYFKSISAEGLLPFTRIRNSTKARVVSVVQSRFCRRTNGSTSHLLNHRTRPSPFQLSISQTTPYRVCCAQSCLIKTYQKPTALHLRTGALVEKECRVRGAGWEGVASTNWIMSLARPGPGYYHPRRLIKELLLSSN